MSNTKKHSASFYFKYPPLGKMKKMTPDQRVSFINSKFQTNLESVTKKLSGQTFQLIGTKQRPRGIRIEATAQILKSISKLPFIRVLFAEQANRKSKTKDISYYCFRTLFQVQIEGKTTGVQTVEERYILVQANSEKAAETKVKRESKDYEKPYLNPYGQMVRWKFESILDSYVTFIPATERFDKPVEVFSTLKGRKLKKENFWDGR